MSHKVYEQFQTTHSDSARPPILTTNLARKLQVSSDYKSGPVQSLGPEQIETYNAILKDKGKADADEWLGTLWA